jgi:hypothetical protein
MNIDGQVYFLIGAILISLGVMVAGAALLALNNLFHRFWKPIPVPKSFTEPSRFIDPATDSTKTEPKQMGLF